MDRLGNDFCDFQTGNGKAARHPLPEATRNNRFAVKADTTSEVIDHSAGLTHGQDLALTNNLLEHLP
jgi:hypothetical protein